MDPKQIRLMYERDREEALRSLRESGIQFLEEHQKDRDQMVEDFQKMRGDVRSALQTTFSVVMQEFDFRMAQTANTVGGYGGIGRAGEALARAWGEVLTSNMSKQWQTVIGNTIEGGVKLYGKYEAIRMTGARMAPVMTAGRPHDANFFNMGRQYVAQSLEIQRVTAESASAIASTATELSRLGIAFDATGMEATKYSLAADKVLNLQQGTIMELQAKAVTDYGQAWEDVEEVILDTTTATQRWNSMAEITSSSEARALASNQTLLTMYKQVMEATKGTSLSMTGMNKFMLFSADVMRKMGLRPDMITSTVGDFLGKMAPRPTGLANTFLQGFILKDVLDRSKEGRNLMDMSYNLAARENIDPSMWTIALNQLLAQSPQLSEVFEQSILENLTSVRDSMGFGDTTSRNVAFMSRMEMMGISPMVTTVALQMSETYNQNLMKGMTREDAMQVSKDSFAPDAAAMGMTPDKIIAMSSTLARDSMSTDQKVTMAAESIMATHKPESFWGKMGEALKGGMRAVVRSGGGDPMAAMGIGSSLPVVERDIRAEDSIRRRAATGGSLPRGSAKAKRLVGSYTKSTSGGVQQVNTFVSDAYFSNDINTIASGIAGIESRGQEDPYHAMGPMTGRRDRAYGKYQIMGENIPKWTKEALGVEMTPEEFLADPAAQEKTAKSKMAEYYGKYGNAADVASMWHSGVPLNKAAAEGRRDALGTMTTDYSARVNEYVHARGTQG